MAYTGTLFTEKDKGTAIQAPGELLTPGPIARFTFFCLYTRRASIHPFFASPDCARSVFGASSDGLSLVAAHWHWRRYDN